MEQQINISCTETSEDLTAAEAAVMTMMAASPNSTPDIEILKSPDSSTVKFNFVGSGKYPY